MRVSGRILSLVLSVVMLASVCLTAASCKGSKGEIKKVQETDPWYEAKRVELDPEFDASKTKTLQVKGPYLIRDKYIMSYVAGEIWDDMPAIYTAPHEWMGIYDKDGNRTHMIDVDEIMQQLAPEGTVIAYDSMGVSECESGARLFFSQLSAFSLFYCDIDLEKGTQIAPPQKVDLSNVRASDNTGVSDGKYVLHSIYPIDDYIVMILHDSNFTHSCLVVLKDLEYKYTVDVDSVFTTGKGSLIYDAYNVSNGKVRFSGFGRNFVLGELDLETGKAVSISEGSSFSSDTGFSVAKDGRAYLSKPDGIYEYDPLNGTKTLKYSFNDCDVNRFECQDSVMLYCDENTAVVACVPEEYSTQGLPPPPAVYTLEKADKNPNAGKTVVTVAALSSFLTFTEAEGIKIFNEQNPEYFAKLTVYDQRSLIEGTVGGADIDDEDKNTYSAAAMISGSLIADIRAGLGPDVVLGASQSVDLLSSTYLTDLTPYLKSKNFDESKYYMNVINAAQIDGKMYFVPIGFTMTGIITDGSKLEPDQKGFTYEQYTQFVREQCNGEEPVSAVSSRMHFITTCIKRDYTGWLKNDNINFDQQGFRDLVTFFKDNIPEGLAETDLRDAETLQPKTHYASYMECIENLQQIAFYNYYGNNLRIEGLPSANGSGPSAVVSSSFSIAADSPVEKGAYALLDALLCEQAQTVNNTWSDIPVNRAAAKAKVDLCVANNKIGVGYIKSSPPDVLGASYQEAMRMAYLFDTDVNLGGIFLDALENVDTLLLPDNSVLVIISEELPPYLLDQKDLDTVIGTINNRAKTVMAER